MANLKLSSPNQSAISDCSTDKPDYREKLSIKKPKSRTTQNKKGKCVGTRLLSKVVPNHYLVSMIRDCIRLTSQAVVHFSMLFNLLLIDLCDKIGPDDSLDKMWNPILCGNDIYETCLKFVLIPNYRQRVKINKRNCKYLDHFNILIQEYFNNKYPISLSVVDECFYNIIQYNIIKHYKKKFFTNIKSTYYKRQRDCVECFVKFYYPKENRGRLVQYITNRINGIRDFITQFDRDINIAKFVNNHQIYTFKIKVHTIQYQPFTVVKYFYFISRYMGALQSKEFHLAPLSRISLKCIELNYYVLANMLGFSNVTSRHSISKICSGIPKNCQQLFTDGMKVYFNNQKGNIRYRLPQKHNENIKIKFSFKNVDKLKWKLYITRYLQIFEDIWNIQLV